MGRWENGETNMSQLIIDTTSRNFPNHKITTVPAYNGTFLLVDKKSLLESKLYGVRSTDVEMTRTKMTVVLQSLSTRHTKICIAVVTPLVTQGLTLPVLDSSKLYTEMLRR